MTTEEQEVKLALTKHINTFLQTDIVDDKFGWVPANLSETMADAAFSVLLAVKGTNDYLQSEGMIS